MKIPYRAVILTTLLAFTSCTIYRSPQRKDFESESPQFRVQNLKVQGCSSTSIKMTAAGALTASRLVTTFQDPNFKEDQFLWEHLISDQSYFESDNLKGVYCAFENI